MKKIITVCLSMTLFLVACNEKQEYAKNSDGSLTWLSIQEAADLKNNDEKYYFIDVYTSWCKWCKVMDEQTFTDPDVIKLLDANFHVVKFNAEQTDLVKWEGKEYIYTSGGRRGIHGLATELLNGRLSYPSFLILDKDRNQVKKINGFRKPEQLIGELNGLVNS